MTVRGQGFASLHSVDEAQSLLLSNIKLTAKTEYIPTAESLGRKLAKDIIAPRDQPGFRRAAMDGFAVIVEDTYGASDTNPRQLDLTGTIEIGDQSVPEIKQGQAIRIATGAPLPDTATGVIRIEDCEILGDVVEIYSSVTKGKNIALANEDVAKGQLVLSKNTILYPWDLGMIESLAIDQIEVFTKPKIATISTGSELIPSKNVPKQGQVIDSNRPAINSWVEEMGADIVESICIDDDPDLIKTKLVELTGEVDLIITTGGTSVGTRDYLAGVIEEIGELLIHGVAIRPGKPVAIGQIIQNEFSTPIIALPGYPLAAFLNFHLFVSKILHTWTGAREIISKKTTVTLIDKIPSKVGTRDFVRLERTDKGASLIRISGAGILSSFIKADYLLEVPDDLEGYNAGDEVEVYVLR